MSFLDKLKKQEASEEKDDLLSKNDEMLNIFTTTTKLGDISIDMEHKLFKVKNATKLSNKNNSGLIKAGRAFAAISTAGLSLAAEAALNAALKKGDKVFTFDELDGYELIEDDSVLTSGGLKSAAVLGVLTGGVGAIVGGITGKKKQKKTVDNLILAINTKDINFPCIMINYIKKTTKVTSKSYKDALLLSRQSMSCLDTIIQSQSKSEEDITYAKTESNNISEAHDPIEKLKKMKDLLDMGIITQEEFETKKKELLNL